MLTSKTSISVTVAAEEELPPSTRSSAATEEHMAFVADAVEGRPALVAAAVEGCSAVEVVAVEERSALVAAAVEG